MPAVGACRDQPGGGQRAQLQGDGAEGDVGHGAMDVAGAQLGAPQQPQDLPTARGGQGGEDRRGDHGHNFSYN